MKNLKTQSHMALLLSLVLLAGTAAYGQLAPSSDAYTNTAKRVCEPTIVEFGVLHAGTGSAQGTFPQGNNPAGAITGYYVTGENVFHGFLRANDGTITSFDPPGSGTLNGSAQGTVPLGIDPQGDIVGQFQDENYLFHGFLRAVDGTFTIIDAPNAGTEANQGTAAGSINPQGVIAGFYIDVNNSFHGFVRARDGAITTFDDPSAGTGAHQGTVESYTEQGINDQGEIIGWYIDSNNVGNGFLRSADGSFTTIDGPDAIATLPVGLTPAGAIAGWFGDANNVGHGFLHSPDGTMTTFDDPNAGTGSNQGTFVLGVNRLGVITGLYTDAGNTNHGYVRVPNGQFTSFDAPHAAGGSITAGTRPVGINPSGAVAGYYIDKNNVNHGFLWTPCPPPLQ
jgi:hypothetical protein